MVVPGADGATLIAVGDVAGRGLEAAKRAWYVRTLIASSADVSADPAQILERANRALVDESGFGAPFVTAACIVFHPLGRVEWALAGHDEPGPPRRRRAAATRNGDTGLPLGVSDQSAARPRAPSSERGAGLLLYTDGLTEARASANGSPQRDGSSSCSAKSGSSGCCASSSGVLRGRRSLEQGPARGRASSPGAGWPTTSAWSRCGSSAEPDAPSVC